MSTVAPPLTTEARRRLVAERQERSLFWKVVHLLGSLQLALLLLATIAIACAVATFYESSFNTKIAQAYIYKAPWFIFWLGVLCINLLAVTLTRWPWQSKHLGFVITHYGIITLLIGAVIGSKLGYEGNVTLHVDEPPVNRVTTSHSVLQIESPANGGLYLRPFDAVMARPSERRPQVIRIPDSKLVLVATDFAEHLTEAQHLVADANGLPGALLKFSTQMMGQSLSLPFVLRADGGMEQDFFGLAKIAFLPELPDRSPQTIAETQVVFAKFAPVIPEGEPGTGASAHLSADGRTLEITTPDGATSSHAMDDLLGKSLTLGNLVVEVPSYWPDFKLVDGQPGTVSDQPNNPAALVRFHGPVAASSDADAKPLLEFAPSGEGIAYQLSRSGTIYQEGDTKAGESFALGWADWQATVEEILPHAALQSLIEPAPEGADGVPGFFAHLRAPDGQEGEPQWIRSGELTTLTLDDQSVRFGYGLELRPIPFTIGLKNFEVPRLEGTDTPANYIASVEFTDPKTGATKDGTAKMNHPASWPGTPFALITGLNYKFSQAQWNPDDLGETTLQVLYDPGWLLKWMGSLAICVGIFIMFYIRPKRKSA